MSIDCFLEVGTWLFKGELFVFWSSIVGNVFRDHLQWLMSVSVVSDTVKYISYKIKIKRLWGKESWDEVTQWEVRKPWKRRKVYRVGWKKRGKVSSIGWWLNVKQLWQRFGLSGGEAILLGLSGETCHFIDSDSDTRCHFNWHCAIGEERMREREPKRGREGEGARARVLLPPGRS